MINVLVHRVEYEKLFIVKIFNFQKSMFFKIIHGTKLFARIHFDSYYLFP